MASGPGQNSRDDLVDPRWTFPNNLDSNKRRPKKQGNKGLPHKAESFALNPSNGDKLNISFSEADHSGQQKQLHPFLISDKKENVKPKQSDPSLYSNQAHHSIQNYEKALNPVTAQELEKLELMISMIQQEQKEKQDQINKDEPRGAEAQPQKIIHPKEKLPVSLHRHPSESSHHTNEAKHSHKRICEKPSTDCTEIKWKMGEKDQMAQNTFDSIDDLYKDLLMTKRIKRLALREQFDEDDSNSHFHSHPVLEEKKSFHEKKNNVDLHYAESPSTLYNNYNCDQGSELEFSAKNSIQEPHSSHSSFESNENKQKQLEEIKDKINQLQKMINVNSEQVSSKNSHLEEIQGKCLRNYNLNQFPARRHYEAEGRANEEPDIAANLAATAAANSEDEENDTYDNKTCVAKKLYKAQIQLQKLMNFVTSLEGNSQSPLPASPKTSFATCSTQQNCPRHEEVLDKVHTSSKTLEQFAADRKNIEFVLKQLNKIFEHLPLSPDILMPMQYQPHREKLTDMSRKFEHFKSHSATESEASQKDNIRSFKQRQSEQNDDNQQQMVLNEELRKQKLILRELLSHRSMEQCYSHRQPPVQNEGCSQSASSINSEEGNSTPPSNDTGAASTAPATTQGQPSATWGGFSMHDNLDDTQPDDDDDDDDDSGLVNYSQFPQPPNNCKSDSRENPKVPKNQSFQKYSPPRQENLHQHQRQMGNNRCAAGLSAPEPSVAAATGAPSSDTSSSSWQWFTQHVQHQLDQMNALFQAIVQEQQVLASHILAPSSLSTPFGSASQPNLSLLLLSLSQCYHMLYMQQLEIQHLHRCIQQSPEFTEQPIPPSTEVRAPERWSSLGQNVAPPPCETLNNQVPPRTRANNFWDNFRSYSCQNLLSSTSSIKNEGLNLPASATTAHDNQLGKRTHRIMNSNDSSSLPAQPSSFYERPIPNVEVQQQMKNKKPNLGFNKVPPCIGQNKPSSSSSEESPSNLATPPCSNVCQPSTKSPAKLPISTGGPFISAMVEFAKILGQSGCGDLGYLIEVLRQVQALNSEPLRMQALRTLQELASHSQNQLHPAGNNSSSIGSTPLEKGPLSSTGAVRKAPKWQKQEQSAESSGALTSCRDSPSSLLDPQHPLHSQLQAFLSKYSELSQVDLTHSKDPTTQASASISTTPKTPFINHHSSSPTVNPSFPPDAQNPLLPNSASDVGPHHRAEEDLNYEPEGDDLAEADQKASDDSLLGAVGGTDENVLPSGDLETQPTEASSRNSLDGIPCDEETQEEDHLPLEGDIPKGAVGVTESHE